MSKIVIIGAGSMGTAFAYPCVDNLNEVSIVGTHLENNNIDDLNKNHFHKGLNLKVIDKIKFYKHNFINEIFKNKIDLIVIAVNSNGIDWIAEELKKISKDNQLPKLLMLTKGLSLNNKKYELLINKLERLLLKKGIKNLNISAIGGPCLAPGLAKRFHSAVVVANKNADTAKHLSKMLSNDYYHVSSSTDINGVEVCAAIKNIYSMVIGAAQGINKIESEGNFYLNTAAALIKQSVYEMEIFSEFLNGKKETVKGLAGLGDLYVSAAGGRNSKLGFFIGQGMTFSEAKKTKMANITVEGAELIFEIGSKVKEDFTYKKLPLMIAMINAILEDKKLDIKWENFQQ